MRLRRAADASFAGVPGPFPSHPRPDTSLDETPTTEQERGMRAFWWDGFWASISETVVMNYLGLYVLAFGASTTQVGLLASLTSLAAAVAFFPGAHVVERHGRRKFIVLLSSGGVSRLVLFGLAFVPFFATGDVAIWTVFALACSRAFFAYFAVPAWTSLAADIVPMGIRGRFLASRSLGMGIATLATAPVAGYFIGRFSGLEGWQIVWTLAFVAGAASTWCYSRIPDAAHERAAEAMPRVGHTASGAMRAMLADRPFVMFLGSVAIWNVALHAAGPFFNVYLIQNLNASTLMVGLLAAVPSVTGLVGLMYFGNAVDRLGAKRVIVVTGLLIPLLPLAWIAVSAAWQVLFINAGGGVIWAGYNLAMSNVVMMMAPRQQRARYAAAFQTVTFASAFVGPLAGAWLIHVAGFRGVFFVSAAGRALSTLIVVRLIIRDRERHG